jgi:glycerophosphoryl diester phosphodiesterase
VTSRRSTPRTGFAFLDEPVDRGEVVAFAHRGGVLHPDVAGLENTVKAFEVAVGLGYRYLETDVRATRDGELLAFHDDHLDRVTDGGGALADLEYAEVTTALVGGREPIPRFAELLEVFPDARFNVDLKSPGGIDPLVDLVTTMGVQDRLCVGSFAERVLRRFRARMRAESSVPVATSCGIVAAAALAFLPAGRRMPGLVRDTGSVLQVPHRFRGRVKVVDEDFVDRAHSSGRHVHVWTINDRAEIEQMLDLGVDGIFTDRPDVLREVLVARGAWDASGSC